MSLSILICLICFLSLSIGILLITILKADRSHILFFREREAEAIFEILSNLKQSDELDIEAERIYWMVLQFRWRIENEKQKAEPKKKYREEKEE